MRANPLVCVEVDEVAAYDQWLSVIAIGRYEELPETPGSDVVHGRAPERSEQQVAEAIPIPREGEGRSSCRAMRW